MFPDDASPRPLLFAAVGIIAVLILMRYTRWGGSVVMLALVALVLCAVAFVIYASAVVWGTWFANRWGRVRRVEATVARKSAREYDRNVTPILAWFSPLLAIIGAILHYGLGLDLYTDWNFWVTFEIRGKETDFRVPEKLYRELEEGMEGVLTSRGERLLRFAIGSISTRASDLPRQTPAMRDETDPWTPGPHIERRK